MPPTPALMLEWLSTGVQLFGLIASFALFNYLRKLAIRIPDLKLSARAKFLMYAMPASQLIALVLARVALRLLRPAVAGRGSPPIMIIGLVSSVIGMCSLVFGVMYLFLLLSFGKRLKEAAATARLIWQVS